MNKIYKVVWNTVRNCYVVGSELISSKSGRHSTSNGKSSSLKVTLTVLALCGMMALGSEVAQAYAADAGTAVASQYVAVLVNDSNKSKRNSRTFDGYSYHKETVSGQTYWVRDGYTIKYEENKRYPGAQKDNIIKAYKTSSYTDNSDAGLLKSNQVMVESAGISTLTGVDLDDVSGGTYVGATNSGSTSTPSSFNYMIKDDNGTYIDAGNTKFGKRFKAATKNKDGTYSYKGEVIANDNLYVVDEQVGVFLTSSGKVYTGKVFGANNEVLMTTKSDEGTMYSYWGADTPDPNTKLADMTIGQFNQALEKVNNNSKAVAGDTIKEIKTTAKTEGGTIDLVRRGRYNSATGQYEGEHKVGSGITITSRGGTNGEDVKIHFSTGENNGFDVAAGSKVEAAKATEDATDITGLKINGETYNIKTGQDYKAGKNITINGNEISATDTDTTYTAGNNVSISDDNVISANNTTLAAGKAEKKGNSYIVKDTAGNEVTLEDVASESVVNETINTTKTDLTNVINEKDKLNVKYDNEMKNTVTLGGSDAKNLVKVSNLAAGTEDHDAVNFSQLKAVADGEDYVTKGSISGDKLTLTRALGGTVEVTGFQEYVEGKDSYVTNAELDGNILTIEQNNGKGTYQIDLSTFANSFSGTDYRIVPNPAKDSEGVYKPDKDGNIVLTVEDSKTGETTSVTLSDIAGMESVNTLVDQTKTVITNEYNTAINNAKTEVEEKIEEAKVHYFSVNPDNISGAGNYDNDGAVGLDSIAVGAGAYADGRLGAAAFGNRSNADGERALAVGYNAKAEGMDTIAIGYSNNDKGAKGTNSIAIGAQADADGTQTIFRGKEYSGTWGNATALGAYTEAGAGATAIGAGSKARGWNSTAVGNRAEASAANGVALGNVSSAMREADAEGSYDYVGYSAGAALSDGERNSTVWHANMGAVSIGNEDFKTGETDEDGNLLHFQYTRQLTGLAAGTADTDAVNVAQLKKSRVELTDGTNTTVKSTNDQTDGHVIYSVDVSNEAIQKATDITGNNGIDVTSEDVNGVKTYKVSAKLSDNLLVNNTGNIDLASVLHVGSKITVDGNKGEITGLTNKTLDTADFATVGRAATEEQLKEVNSKATAAKTTVTAGKNIAVNGTSDENGSAYTVALADDVSLGNNAIQLKGTDGSISAKSGGAQLAFNTSGLTVSQAKNGLTNETRINGAEITVDGGIGNQTTIKGSTARIGSVLVNGGGGTATISGLTNRTTKYDGFATAGRAATEEQLKEVAGQAGEAIETAGKGWNLTTNKGTATNIAPGGTVDFSSRNDNLLISNAGANLSFSLSDNLDLTKNDSKKGSVKVGENTILTDGLLQVGTDVSLTASALNVGNSSLTTSALTVGGWTYISSSGLNANKRVISNVAAGKADTDAVNVGQLKSAISRSQISIKAGDGISVAKTGNQYTINVNIEGVTNNQGKVTVSTGDSTSTESGSESGSSGAKKFKVMDLMYRAEANEVAEETTTDTGKAIKIESIPEDIKLEADDNQATSVVNGETIKIAGDGTNISTAATITRLGSDELDTISVSLKPDIKVDSVTINNGGPTINNTGIDMNGKNITNVENITVNNGPTINSSGIDMNSQNITNLKDGEIAEGSKDAVNGGQLYNTNQAVIANAENINSLSHSLNKLDSRINRVGAGAAALAALHPLDFDPDNKWDFAAGYGNYAGANAVAIGTYYRPNENTMFSIGGSFGGGENMINAGVSFKLGSGGSGITTSKTVMAKKIKEQDELLKAQDAKMKEQDEKIAKLEALVAQQGEMIQQALGKK